MAHDLYRETILAHYRKPSNRRTLENANRSGYSHNPLCGDELTVYARVEDGRVDDGAFEARSCSIVQASADMMIDLLRGRSIADVDKLIARFQELMTGNVDSAPELGEIEVFREVRKFPVRVKCALLPWETLEHALVEG